MATQVQIPGQMIATIENGRITGYTFTPAAADAGYFGPDIFHLEGDKISSEDFFELVSQTLATSQDKKSAFFVAEWEC